MLPKLTWLIDEVSRAGLISFRELSDHWERRKDLSDGRQLSHATFDRWRSEIRRQFGINIDCQKSCSYLYYISNPEEIHHDKLKKWMLDSFSVSNAICDNLTLKGRIIVDEIPSGREHLTTILGAMEKNQEIEIEYCSFQQTQSTSLRLQPYCVKLFEKRWYVIARNDIHDDVRIYGLDRIISISLTDKHFQLPKDFDAEEYFSTAYGIVIDRNLRPERILLRAYDCHKHYLQSLPLHHTQRMVEDFGEFADFDLYLVPSYDFVMQLLHFGPMVEVLKPAGLRDEMKGWIREMSLLYNEE